MALIPLKDEVSLKKGGNVDPWGNPTYGASVTYNARIDNSTEVVRDQNGNEVVSNTQILLGGVVALSYDDLLVYTDSLGNTYEKKPISIGTIKDIASKVLFTEVSV